MHGGRQGRYLDPIWRQPLGALWCGLLKKSIMIAEHRLEMFHWVFAGYVKQEYNRIQRVVDGDFYIFA